MTTGIFHRFAFSEAGPAETGQVLEALETTVNFHLDRHEGQRMEMDVAMRLMPEAFVSSQWIGGVLARREGFHAARDGNDDLCLLVPMGGAPTYLGLPDRRHGRHEAMATPGVAALLRGNDERYLAHSPGSKTMVICVPRAKVVTAVPDLDRALYSGVAQSAALALLSGFAQTLASDIGPVEPKTARRAGEILTDLFILALNPARDATEAARGSARTAKLSQVKEDILANLANPDLSIEWLARRHGLRPRGIQDLFYAVGEGYTEFVKLQRLDLAHRLLTDPAAARHNIAEIALASGFGDISWFNNAFRKRFGMTPSEARLQARLSDQDRS